MIYPFIREARVLRRPKRFIDITDLDEAETVRHVNYTDRSRKLLVPGVRILPK